MVFLHPFSSTSSLAALPPSSIFGSLHLNSCHCSLRWNGAPRLFEPHSFWHQQNASQHPSVILTLLLSTLPLKVFTLKVLAVRGSRRN